MLTAHTHHPRVGCRRCCRAWRGSGELPFLLDTVWDLLCLLDYLQLRCPPAAAILLSVFA